VRPVHFVNEYDVREERPGGGTRSPLFVDQRAANLRTGNVRRQQVRRKLNAPEAQAKRARNGLCEQVFSRTGNILQQDLAITKKRNHQEFNCAGSPYHYFCHMVGTLD
jgi:hypothetical protein